MPHVNKVALLASGGMDSTVLAYYLLSKGKDINLIYINYGQHFINTEMSSLYAVMPNELMERIKIIDLSSIYTESKSPLIRKYDLWNDVVNDKIMYIPYRSLVMLSAGMGYAQSIGCEELYAGFIDSNYVNDVDCSDEFFGKLDAVNNMYEAVRLNFPFRYMTKEEVLNIGIQLNAPIGLSFSCQINESVPCGACANCVDRQNAINSWVEKNSLL